MTKEVYEWSLDEIDNMFAPAEGGAPELMQRSTVNDSARARMAAFRRYYDDPEWLTFSSRGAEPGQKAGFVRAGATQIQLILAGQDFTSFLPIGSIVRVLDGLSAGNHLVAKVEAVTYDGISTTTVTLENLDGSPPVIDPGATGIQSHAMRSLRSSAFGDQSSDFFIPATNDSAGIQAAVDDAQAAGGGTVFLAAGTYTINSEIVIGPSASVRVVGSTPATVLRQTVGSALAQVLRIESGNFDVLLDGFSIDNQAEPSTGVFLNGVVRASLRNISFFNGQDGLRLSSIPSMATIEDCAFEGYTRFGIAANAVSDTHEVFVGGCRFSGFATSDPDAAAIKLARSSRIVGNKLESIGRPSGNPRGIWLWNENIDDGGKQSVVMGNEILMGGQVGTAIEIGADSVSCVGNILLCQAGNVGIHVLGTTGGQVIGNVGVSSNQISGGSCIRTNERARGVVVQGNSVRPSAGSVGIEVGDDESLVEGNYILGGSTGIRFVSTSANGMASSNVLASQTAEAVLVDGSSGTLVARNRIVGSTTVGIRSTTASQKSKLVSNWVNSTIATPVVSESPSDTMAIGNDRKNLAFSSEAALSGLLTAQDTGADRVVLSGSPWSQDGPAGRYEVLFRFSHSGVNPSGGNTSVTFNIRVGANGDASDPSIASRAVVAPAGITEVEESSLIDETIIAEVGSDSDKLTVTMVRTSGGGTIVSGVALLRVRKIGDE